MSARNPRRDGPPLTIGGEPADGFLVGKEAALADWRFRKEQTEFAVLVNRLRVRKWQKEAQADPVKVISLRQRKREWAKRPENRARQLELQRQHRAELRMKLVHSVQGCVACGVQWTAVPWTRRVYVRDFCSDGCRQNFRYATDPIYREKKKAAARRTHERTGARLPDEGEQ